MTYLGVTLDQVLAAKPDRWETALAYMDAPDGGSPGTWVLKGDVWVQKEDDHGSVANDFRLPYHPEGQYFVATQLQTHHDVDALHRLLYTDAGDPIDRLHELVIADAYRPAEQRMPVVELRFLAKEVPQRAALLSSNGIPESIRQHFNTKLRGAGGLRPVD